MIKKIMKYGVFALTLTSFSLFAVGCGSSSDGEEKKELTTTKEDTAPSTQEVTTEDVTTTNDTNNSDITMEEQVLLDQDGLKITGTEIVQDSIFGTGMKLLIENNTSNNLGVQCNAVIINNYMISDLFSGSIASGKKANETLYFSSSELEAAGITNIGQIELYFHVFNGDTYETIFDAPAVTVQTSAFDSMDTTPVDQGIELYNQDGIRIVGKYVDENSFWGSAVLLFLENNTDKNIGIQCENMSINGFMITPFFSSSVYSGKMSIDDITIMSSDLEENNIKSIDELELSFKIFDPETYESLVETDPISFSTK